MDKPSAAAVPETGNSDSLSFEDLASDPEIAPLLEFAPVPRQVTKRNGWTPAAQRIFIAWLAHYGSPSHACAELGKARSGIDKLYGAADADEFRASWDAAVALFERRRIERMQSRHGGNGALRAPTPSRGRVATQHPALAPGQVYNELGEPEDAESYRQRGEDACESIATKLLRCRRLFLAEIAGSPGKRAAFEILTDLPIDWDKAHDGVPQDHEPWHRTNMRQPDMVLTAESGWLRSFVPYGPDKIRELQEAINRHRVEDGLPPITDWDEDAGDDDGESAEGGQAEDDAPSRHSREGGNPVEDSDAPPVAEGPPQPRTFGLNSQEFYDAVAKPGRRAIIPQRD